MVLVVVTVDGITALPARREHDLQANTILTVRIEVGLVGHVVAVKGSFGGLVVVETVKAKRTLFKIALRSLAQSLPRRLLRVRLTGIAEGVSSSLVCARQHSEVRRESGNVVSEKEVVTGLC